MKSNRMILAGLAVSLASFCAFSWASVEDRATRTLDDAEKAILVGGLNGKCPGTDPNCIPQSFNTTPCADITAISATNCANSVYQSQSGSITNCINSGNPATDCVAADTQTVVCLYQMGCGFEQDLNGGRGGCKDATQFPSGRAFVPTRLTATTNCTGGGGAP